jgi:putative membrane protein
VKNLLIKLTVNSVSLLAVANLFSGIYVDRWQSAVVAALALTLVNTFLKPVIILLTLPLNIFSLGLFTFVINGLMFYLVSDLVPGFYVDSFLWAFFGSLVFGAMNFLLNMTFIPKKHRGGRGTEFTYRKYNAIPGGKYGEVVDAEAEKDLPEIEDGSKRS